MHDAVVHRSKVRIAVGEVIDVHPPHNEDGGVVIHMEKGDLVFLLAEGHDNSVEELVDLRSIEKPQEIGHGLIFLQRRGEVFVAEKRVSLLQSFSRESVRHVPTRKHQDDIMKHSKAEEVVRLPLPHPQNQQERHDDVRDGKSESPADVHERQRGREGVEVVAVLPEPGTKRVRERRGEEEVLNRHGERASGRTRTREREREEN